MTESSPIIFKTLPIFLFSSKIFCLANILREFQDKPHFIIANMLRNLHIFLKRCLQSKGRFLKLILSPFLTSSPLGF